MLKNKFWILFFYSSIAIGLYAKSSKTNNGWETDLALYRRRLAVLDTRTRRPWFLVWYGDRSLLVKTSCIWQDHKLVPEHEWGYNTLTSQRRETSQNIALPDPIPNYPQKHPKLPLGRNSKYSEAYWADPLLGGSGGAFRMPTLIKEYLNRVPMLWFVPNQKSLALLIQYFQRTMTAMGIAPIATNKLYLIVEEEGFALPDLEQWLVEGQYIVAEGAIGRKLKVKKTKPCQYRIASELQDTLDRYFSLAQEPEEQKHFLKVYLKMLQRLEDLNESRFTQLYSNWWSSCKGLMGGLAQKLLPKDIFSCAAACTLILSSGANNSERRNQIIQTIANSIRIFGATINQGELNLASRPNLNLTPQTQVADGLNHQPNIAFHQPRLTEEALQQYNELPTHSSSRITFQPNHRPQQFAHPPQPSTLTTIAHNPPDQHQEEEGQPYTPTAPPFPASWDTTPHIHGTHRRRTSRPALRIEIPSTNGSHIPQAHSCINRRDLPTPTNELPRTQSDAGYPIRNPRSTIVS